MVDLSSNDDDDADDDDVVDEDVAVVVVVVVNVEHVDDVMLQLIPVFLINLDRLYFLECLPVHHSI